MKIAKISLREFKRFSHTEISGLPATAKLVILAGPNGCGKSSLFDALNTWRRARTGGMDWQPDYFQKQSAPQPYGWNESINVEFHNSAALQQNDLEKSIYVRSAYRNDPEFNISSLTKSRPATQENRLHRLIDNDATVLSNYQRLVAQGLEDVFETELETTTIGEFREKTIGEIKCAFSRLFPTLVLNSLGNPLASGTFKFDKGSSKGFLYKNLSGGEKAAFDLLLDLIVKKREFDNTVFCIDEPEAHMSVRLQNALLKELCDLLPQNSQLWLATHSIGMMRRARDLATSHPTEVVFLDFECKDFDVPQVVKPVTPNRQFWLRVLNVALDDMAELVAPSEVIICEGAPVGTSSRNTAIDASCYDTIFAGEYPDTQFLSGGNASDVEGDRLALIEGIRSLVKGTALRRLIDRDDLSAQQIAEKRASGVRVLSRRHLESYLYDDEVLTALCEKVGQPAVAVALLTDKSRFIAESVQRGNPEDDIKSASGPIYGAAKQRLGLTRCGNDAKAFMRDTLAPLLVPGMASYAELKADIFGA